MLLPADLDGGKRWAFLAVSDDHRRHQPVAPGLTGPGRRRRPGGAATPGGFTGQVTVQTKDMLRPAAVTVTVLVPRTVAEPVICPVPVIEMPAGRPVAAQV